MTKMMMSLSTMLILRSFSSLSLLAATSFSGPQNVAGRRVTAPTGLNFLAQRQNWKTNLSKLERRAKLSTITSLAIKLSQDEKRKVYSEYSNLMKVNEITNSMSMNQSQNQSKNIIKNDNQNQNLIQVTKTELESDTKSSSSLSSSSESNESSNSLRSTILPRSRAFPSGGEACCGCFQARHLAATDGKARQCGTCYVADTYQVLGTDKVVSNVNAGRKPSDRIAYDFVTDSLNVEFMPGDNLKACASLCDSNENCGVYALFENECHLVVPRKAKAINFDGEGTSSNLGLSTPNKMNVFQMHFPGIRYYNSRSDEGVAYSIVSQSKQEGIHSWYWSCADGFASPDPSIWQGQAAVEGEPPSRSLYQMCEEPSSAPDFGGESVVTEADVLTPAANKALAQRCGLSVEEKDMRENGLNGKGGSSSSDVKFQEEEMINNPYVQQSLQPKLLRPWEEA